MHATRHEAVVALVSSSLAGASLAVTSLGRGIGGRVYEKHRIKRADRLMSNAHLSGERVTLYTSLARRVIAGTPRPLVSVDWSNLDDGKTRYLLRASVAVEGRALTLYEQVHPRAEFMKAAVERQFLKRLADVLGPACRPIVITDAGFHNPWLSAVHALGWDFIGRVRGRVMLGDEGGDHWDQARSLFALAGKHPKRLTKSRLSRANPITCEFVIHKQGRRGRRHLNRDGRVARAHYSREQARSQREPWLLATSLDSSTVGAMKRIVRAYKTRMQIEEAFRDLKCERFGMGLENHRCNNVQRMAILLLIAMLALFVAWLMGKALELSGKHPDYQANSVKNRTVLSTIFLGLRVIDSQRTTLSANDINDAIRHLQQYIVENHNGE